MGDEGRGEQVVVGRDVDSLLSWVSAGRWLPWIYNSS